MNFKEEMRRRKKNQKLATEIDGRIGIYGMTLQTILHTNVPQPLYIFTYTYTRTKPANKQTTNKQ